MEILTLITWNFKISFWQNMLSAFNFSVVFSEMLQVASYFIDGLRETKKQNCQILHVGVVVLLVQRIKIKKFTNADQFFGRKN